MYQQQYCNIKNNVSGNIYPVICDQWRQDFQYRLLENNEPMYSYIGIAIVEIPEPEKKNVSPQAAPKRSSGNGCGSCGGKKK